eukprot:1675312-Rhodomonas_salina.1
MEGREGGRRDETDCEAGKGWAGGWSQCVQHALPPCILASRSSSLPLPLPSLPTSLSLLSSPPALLHSAGLRAVQD